MSEELQYDEGRILTMEDNNEATIIVDRAFDRCDLDNYSEQEVVDKTNTPDGLKCFLLADNVLTEELAELIFGGSNSYATEVPKLEFVSKEVSNGTVYVKMTSYFGLNPKELAIKLHELYHEFVAVTCKNAAYTADEEIVAVIVPRAMYAAVANGDITGEEVPGVSDELKNEFR